MDIEREEKGITESGQHKNPPPADSTSLAELPSKPIHDTTHADSGLGVYAEALELDPEHLEQLAKKVLWKLDLILLPLMAVTYMVSYLEKSTLNYANAYSLQADLGLAGRDYAWSAAITNLGIMAGSYPSSLAVQKLPVGKFISGLLIIWGMLSMCLAAAKNFAGIFSIRLILGLAESGIGPAWLMLTSMFWTRDEQPLRLAIWIGSNGLASMIGAGIAIGLGSVTETAVRPWQLIFLVVGSLGVALGIFCFFILPSSPHDAVFLTREEKIACVWRIAKNHTGIKSGHFQKHQVYEALRDFRTWCLLIQQFTVGLMNGSLTNYFSAFLVGFGWSSMKAVEYQLPIGAVQIFATAISGWLASRYRNSSIIIILALAVFAIAALVGFSTIPSEEKMALTACTWIVSVYSGAMVLNWSIVASNFAGHTKRSTIQGINFVAYWGGNFAGPFVFNPAEAPRYPTATRILGGMFGFGWIATAAMGVYMWNANRKRDAKAAAGDLSYDPSQGAIEGFTDRTDKENKSFRYRY